MSRWRILDYYHSEEARNLFNEWYESQDKAVQSAFDWVLGSLLGFPDWNVRKEFKALRRRHGGLCEIIFKVGRTNYRVLGFFSCNPWEFILVTGLEKSGRSPKPPDAFDKALAAEREFNTRKGLIHDHQAL